MFKKIREEADALPLQVCIDTWLVAMGDVSYETEFEEKVFHNTLIHAIAQRLTDENLLTYDPIDGSFTCKLLTTKH